MELHLESRGPYIHARLEGNVDETLDLTRLLEAARGKRVVMVLRGVQRLSSFGVREWTYTMRQLSHKAEQVYFAECSPAIVAQLNMVANFGGAARIMSVQAPYYCPKCDHDTQVTLNLTGMHDIQLGGVNCPSCNADMEFDEDPDSYLSYAMKHQASERSNPGWDGLVLPLPSNSPSPSHSNPSVTATVPGMDLGEFSSSSGSPTGPQRSSSQVSYLSSPGSVHRQSDIVPILKASLIGLADSTALSVAVYLLWLS